METRNASEFMRTILFVSHMIQTINNTSCNKELNKIELKLYKNNNKNLQASVLQMYRRQTAAHKYKSD